MCGIGGKLYFDPARAVDLYRTALDMARRDLLQTSADDASGMVLYFAYRLGESLTQAGEPEHASAMLAEALALGLGGAEEKARLLKALAEASLARSRFAEAEKAARDGLQIAIAAGRGRTAASLHRVLAELHAKRGEFAAAVEELQGGIELLASGEDSFDPVGRAELGMMFIRLVRAHLDARSPREAVAAANHALRSAERAGDGPLAARAAAMLAEAHQAAGDTQSAKIEFARAVDLARRAGDFVSTRRWQTVLGQLG